jgi:multisubunit Na+/H+ antiporter MnhF subunit
MLAPQLHDLLVIFDLLVANSAHMLLLIFNVLMLDFASANDIKGLLVILSFVESASLFIEPVFCCSLSYFI